MLRPAVHYFQGLLLTILLTILMGISGAQRLAAQQIYKDPAVSAVYSDGGLHLDAVILTDTGVSLKMTAKGFAGQYLNIPKQSYICFEKPTRKNSSAKTATQDPPKYYLSHVTSGSLGDKNKFPKSGQLQYTLHFPMRLKAVKARHKGAGILHFGEDLPGGKQIYGIDYLWQNKPFDKALIGKWYDKQTGRLAFVITPEAVITENKVGQILREKSSANTAVQATGQFKIRFNGRSDMKTSDSNQSAAPAIQTLYYSRSKAKAGETFWEISLDKSTLGSHHYTQDLTACTKKVSKKGYGLDIYRTDTCTVRGFILGYAAASRRPILEYAVENVLMGDVQKAFTTIQPDGQFTIKRPVYAPIKFMYQSDFGQGDWYVEPGKTLFVVLGAGQPLYMGPLQQLNDAMHYLNKTLYGNYNAFYKGIAKKNSDGLLQLKTDLLNQQKTLMARLAAIYQRGRIGKKAYEVKKTALKYSFAKTLLLYEWQGRMAGDTLGMDQQLAGTYYNFIDSSYTDNPDILRYGAGFYFVNYLKYNKRLLTERLDPSVTDVSTELELKLEAQGKDFTKAEQLVIEQTEALLGHKTDGRGAAYKDYYQRTQNFVDQYYWELNTSDKREQRDRKLKALGLKNGWISDVMFVQDYAAKVCSELTPVDTAALTRMQMDTKNPFIKTQMAVLNNRVLDKIAQNKFRTGYAVKSTKGIQPGDLLDSIIAQNIGHVLYIDFWATWCGPCREAIQTIRPVKEELAARPVKFIYITDESSPLKTWEHFIPQIKGLHYRLAKAQYEALSKRLKITGMPQVIIVDKTGNIVNPNYYGINARAIKKTIEKYL